MKDLRPRIAVPEPTSTDHAYNQRGWPQYAHAITSCNGIAVPVPLTESQATVAHLLSTCCAILLPGSPADLNPQKYGQSPVPESAAPDPGRESVDELMLQDAFNLHKPVLGICYGLQSLNAWRNGTLTQHLATPVNHAPGRQIVNAHTILILATSRLGAICLKSGEGYADSQNQAVQLLDVNSSHHQAVATAGDGLDIVGRSAEDGVIEALELASPDHYVMGVQWHPERSFDFSAASRAIFASFVAAAAAWKIRPISDSVVQKSVPVGTTIAVG